MRLEAEGSRFAGQRSKYIFEFRTTGYIPDNNFIRLYFPKGDFSIFEFPPCRAYPIDLKLLDGTLNCVRKDDNPDWDVIDIEGVKGDLPKDTKVSIEIIVNNPDHELITNNFGIGIIRKNTNVIYE